MEDPYCLTVCLSVCLHIHADNDRLLAEPRLFRQCAPSLYHLLLFGVLSVRSKWRWKRNRLVMPWRANRFTKDTALASARWIASCVSPSMGDGIGRVNGSRIRIATMIEHYKSFSVAEFGCKYRVVHQVLHYVVLILNWELRFRTRRINCDGTFVTEPLEPVRVLQNMKLNINENYWNDTATQVTN